MLHPHTYHIIWTMAIIQVPPSAICASCSFNLRANSGHQTARITNFQTILCHAKTLSYCRPSLVSKYSTRERHQFCTIYIIPFSKMTETMALTSSMMGEHVGMSLPIVHMSDNSTRCSTQQVSATDGWSWSDIPCGGFVEEVPWKLPRSSNIINNDEKSVAEHTSKVVNAATTTKALSFPLPAPTDSLQRHVSFSPSVQIRTHELIAGDHPCCKDGLALACGWAIVREQQVETTAKAHSSRRMAKLLLTPRERWVRLHGTEPSSESTKFCLPRTDSERELLVYSTEPEVGIMHKY